MLTEAYIEALLVDEELVTTLKSMKLHGMAGDDLLIFDHLNRLMMVPRHIRSAPKGQFNNVQNYARSALCGRADGQKRIHPSQDRVGQDRGVRPPKNPGQTCHMGLFAHDLHAGKGGRYRVS